jgi:MerR family Zn(II)-responsive transcriptional regulator of zntA
MTASGSPGGEERLLKIGDFAKLAGTNLRTLRYYEEIGLLQPASRSSGGFRFYRPEDLDRLRMVASLQRLGLELASIRELMDTRVEGRTRAEFLSRVRRALREQANLIDERIAALTRQRAGLDTALGKLSECESCEHHPAAENNFCHPCQVDGRAVPPDLSALF